MGLASTGPQVSGSARYGTLDRLLHRLAFRVPTTQRTLAEVEEALYGARLEETEPGEPVFIASLPRAGTTILLRLLWRTGAFASTLYRDMPFVLAPLLWSRFARRFSGGSAGEAGATERDHGDGLLISGDSPEGFEEVVWKRFWPERYREDRILPWTEGRPRPEFERFFETHARKVVALRREEAPGRTRYLSKNNANIARLAAPPAPLRRGTVLVPVREPLQHAASLLRQHERFCALQDEDPFLLEYMESIGHHDFGRGLKPIDFGGWLSGAPEGPGELTFWLRYWVAACGHLLEAFGSSAASRITFLSYDRLTSEPEGALRRLGAIVGVEPAVLVPLAGEIRAPRTHDVSAADVPSALLEEAEAIHRRLEELARV